MPELNWNLDTLLLFLSHATLSIPDEYKDRVFKGMADKLMEWEHIPMAELQEAYHPFGVALHPCDHCGYHLEPGECCCDYEGQLCLSITPLSTDSLPPLPPSPVESESRLDHIALEGL